MFCLHNPKQLLCHGDFKVFGENRAESETKHHLFIYEMLLEHQAKDISNFLFIVKTFGPIRGHYEVLKKTTDFTFFELSTSGCYTVLTRANQLETAVHGCIFDFRFGLYHVVSSFLRSISLAYLTSKIYCT